MIKTPEAVLVDNNGHLLGYVTEANDCYGHQVYCYDISGHCLYTFSAKEAAERGWKNGYDVAKWFDQELAKR